MIPKPTLSKYTGLRGTIRPWGNLFWPDIPFIRKTSQNHSKNFSLYFPLSIFLPSNLFLTKLYLQQTADLCSKFTIQHWKGENKPPARRGTLATCPWFRTLPTRFIYASIRSLSTILLFQMTTLSIYLEPSNENEKTMPVIDTNNFAQLAQLIKGVIYSCEHQK